MIVCVGIAAALGLDLAATTSALSEASVPGRLERCDGPADDVVVVVDYAHTPDALERALSALNVLREGTSSRGRLICVFGCGGDRDPNKRAPMGRAVATWADVAVLTTDNPRTEDPEAIVKAIMPGLEHARAVIVELDRERAIHDAIATAKPGDVVLIAGKGHETYQIVGNVARHFDDREQARLALARRRAPGGDS
jgi:UDP-N-acetylmuramoyl-L-alanyl-D-glutamate--2,6-diaminopimelate ligase